MNERDASIELSAGALSRSLEGRDRALRTLCDLGGRLPLETASRLVVIGGLVPETLCDRSPDVQHTGTSDADIQVDLLIEDGASASELEKAMLEIGLDARAMHGYMWRGNGVKVEFFCEQEVADRIQRRHHRGPGPLRVG
jgi:hypothetical protein